MKPKAIHTASDPNVDFNRLGDFLDKHHIDRLMAYVKSIGSSRHQWQIERKQDYHESYPHGFELFPEVVKAAHRHDLELIGQFKPFEAFPRYYPHTLPDAPGLVWSDFYGRLLQIPPFVAQHPEFCMQRWSGEEDPGGVIRAIRIFKGDDQPTAIRKEHLSVWVSDQLGKWEPYAGNFTLDETIAEVNFFPRARPARILTLDNLSIPDSVRYIEVRLSDDCPEQDFVTPLDSFMELVGESDQSLPSTPALKDKIGPMPDTDSRNCKTVRYFKDESVRHQLAQMNTAEQLDNMRSVSPAAICQQYAFHRDRRATIARGKQQRLPILNPIYPEVRAYWLKEVEYMLDSGADGVNVRPSSHYHFWCKEPWAFGYNDKTLEGISSPPNCAEVAEVNGRAFDTFLQEAAEMVHSRGKILGVHVLTNAFHAQNSVGKILNFANVAWNWKNWIRDSVDYVELRGIGATYDPMVREMVDSLALECRRHGKQLTLQCDRAIVKRTDPIFEWEKEMQWALKHPGIHNYCLWETGFFTQFGDDGNYHGPASLKDTLAANQPS